MQSLTFIIFIVCEKITVLKVFATYGLTLIINRERETHTHTYFSCESKTNQKSVTISHKTDVIYIFQGKKKKNTQPPTRNSEEKKKFPLSEYATCIVTNRLSCWQLPKQDKTNLTLFLFECVVVHVDHSFTIHRISHQFK